MRLHDSSLPARRTALGALAALAAAWALGVAAPAAADARAAGQADLCDLTTSGRIVAIGDVHGSFDTYVSILRAAGLIDEDRDWIGGNTVFVQLGDVVDRGRDSTEVLDLLQSLERQASRSDGAVHFLLGNHEVMRMIGDLSYVNPEEYEEFKGPQAAPLRESFFEIVYEQRLAEARAAGQDLDDRAFRAQFFEDTPLGLVEMLQAFDPEGDYGRWLRQQDVLVKINGILFVHGGINPAIAVNGCSLIAEVAREEIDANWSQPNMNLLTREDGPLWYRGLVDGTATQADVDAILQAMNARAVVVGHTVTEDHRIDALFGNTVFAIDTGLAGGEYFPGGVASALEIQGDTFTAIYAGGERVVLSGGDR